MAEEIEAEKQALLEREAERKRREKLVLDLEFDKEEIYSRPRPSVSKRGMGVPLSALRANLYEFDTHVVSHLH